MKSPYALARQGVEAVRLGVDEFYSDEAWLWYTLEVRDDGVDLKIVRAGHDAVGDAAEWFFEDFEHGLDPRHDLGVELLRSSAAARRR